MILSKRNNAIRDRRNLSLIFIGVIMLALAGGWLLPRITLDDRNGTAWGERATTARWAVTQAQQFFDNPIQRFIIIAYSVERIDVIPLKNYPELPPEAGTKENLGILVKTYTFFGLPYKRLYITSTSSMLVD